MYGWQIKTKNSDSYLFLLQYWIIIGLKIMNYWNGTLELYFWG